MTKITWTKIDRLHSLKLVDYIKWKVCKIQLKITKLVILKDEELSLCDCVLFLNTKMLTHKLFWLDSAILLKLAA